jgi:hypothetical protein
MGVPVDGNQSVGIELPDNRVRKEKTSEHFAGKARL